MGVLQNWNVGGNRHFSKHVEDSARDPFAILDPSLVHTHPQTPSPATQEVGVARQQNGLPDAAGLVAGPWSRGA